MDPRLFALADILKLNTRLFRNCLDVMSEAQALARPTTATNSATFVATHVADSRFYLLTILGAKHVNPLAEYVAKGRSISDIEQLPDLDTIREAWTTASHALRERLDAISPAELDAPVETRLPLPTKTVLSVTTFLVQHDSHHVGQLALLRKYVGMPPMKYS